MAHSFSSVLGLALVAFCLTACGASPKVSVTAPSAAVGAVKTTPQATLETLRSGLVIRNVRRSKDETCAVQLWLPAGSRFEGDAPAGVAAAVAELTRRSVAAQLPPTASVSTWVEADSTVFAVITTPADLDEALGILASAVSTLDASPAHIEASQRAHQALVSRLRAQPHRAAMEALFAEAYSPHGLGRPPLGGEPAAWSPDALSRFHGTHYGPQGAHLIFVGPETDGSSLQRARRHFGAWRGGTAPHPVADAAPSAPQLRVQRNDTAEGYVRVAIRVDSDTPRDAAVYDLLTQLLGTPSTGRIAQAARIHGLSLRAADSFLFSPLGPGQLVLALDGDPDEVDRLWSVAIDALRSLRERPPSITEVSRAREALLTAERRLYATPDSHAERVGRAMRRWPSDPDGQQWRNAIATVSVTDVAESAREILAPNRFTAIVSVPRTASAEDDRFWAESLTERLQELAGAGPISNEGGLIELRPGLNVVVHPMAQTGVVAIRVTTLGGSRAEGAHERGVSAMAASLWETVSQTAQVSASAHTIEATAITDPSALEETLRDLVSGLAPNRWTTGTFERARALALARTRTLRDDRSQWTKDLASGHDRRPIADRLASIETLGATAVRPWFETFVEGADTMVAVVGAVDPDRAYRAVRTAFRSTSRRAQGVALRPQDAPPPKIHHATDDGLLHHWESFDLSVAALEDRATLRVIAEVLADGEIAVDVHSSLVNGRGRWAVGVSEPAEAKGRGPRSLARRLETLRGGPLPDEVVRLAAQRAMARETLRLRHPETRAGWLAEQARTQRPLTGSRAIALWRAALGRVTPAAIHALAKSKLMTPASTIRIGPIGRFAPPPRASK